MISTETAHVRGIDITVGHIATERTDMGTHRQTLLDDLATFEALLRCEALVHSNHLMTSSLSLFTQDVEKCAPTGVHDALCQGMVLCHVENLKLLNSNHLVLLGVRFGRFEMEITALTRDLEMRLRHIFCRFPTSVTALLNVDTACVVFV